MLSFFYQLGNEFRIQHGYWPNVLFINAIHHQRLFGEIKDQHHPQASYQILELKVIGRQLLHPRVGLIEISDRKTA